MTGLRFVAVDPARPDARLLRIAYDEVLEPAFPRSELAPFDAFAAAFSPGADADGTVVVALDAGDDVVGAAVEQRYRESRIGLLGYLATRRDRRGRGVGAEVMGALAHRWATQALDVVVGEVEDPRVHPETDENRTRARIRFYERQGADVLDVPWTQPGLDDGPRVPGFFLLRMWHRRSAEDLRAGELAAWADRYFEEEEGAVPDDDGYRALRAELLRVDPVPVVPIDRIDAT